MTSKITLVENASAAATPASGDLAVYAKTDGKLYYKRDDGTEVELYSAASASTLDSSLRAFAVAMAIAL